ncbi:MAG: hypothetical protein WDM80_09975 [Limisphaerales bacterium]
MAAGRLLPMLMGCLFSQSMQAQEAVRSSLAGNAAATAIAQQQQSADYTYKNGDFRLFVTPSVSLQWNDNINLTKVGPQSDYILTPMVGIEANYPIGKQNLLNLSISVGYQKYFDHNEYSQFTLNAGSGSGLSFDLMVEDVRFNFHDRFQYAQQGAAQAIAAGPGTGTYGTFVNTIGVTSFWDLSRLTFVVGYDHQNTLATSSQFDQVNQSSELFNVQAGYMVDSGLTVGLQSTASLVTYQENELNNNNVYSFGTYADWNPEDAITVHAGLGYSLYAASQTSVLIQSQNVNSWYANLIVTHKPLSYFSYSLSGGHELTPGFQSGALEDWYIRPSATWGVIKNVTLQTSLFYEHGDTVGGQLPGNSETRFSWYGGEINLSCMPHKKITTSIFYRLTFRTSNVYANEYTQNLVGLQLTYVP